MPCSAPVSRAEAILKKSRLRMKFFTAWVDHENFALGHADVQVGAKTQALGNDRDEAIGELRATLLWISAGNAETTRCSASAQVEECTVASTRWPVSAAFSVSRMVSGSRISPTISTSGSSRNASSSACSKARRVAADFALANVGAARAKGVFDRAFDRDDVPRFGEVDLLDQRGERRRFAGAGRPADQDQAVWWRDEFLEVGMQVELLDGGLKRGEQPDGEADAARGLQDVDAAAHAVNGLGKIERAPLQKVRPLFVADDGCARISRSKLGRDRFASGAQGAANAQRGRQTGFQMQITGAILLGQANQRFQIHL